MDDSCTPLYKDPPSGLKIGDLVQIRPGTYSAPAGWIGLHRPGIVIGIKTITYVDDIIFPNRAGLPVSIGAAKPSVPSSITWHEIYWAEKGIFRHVGKELEKL